MPRSNPRGHGVRRGYAALHDVVGEDPDQLRRVLEQRLDRSGRELRECLVGRGEHGQLAPAVEQVDGLGGDHGLAQDVEVGGVVVAGPAGAGEDGVDDGRPLRRLGGGGHGRGDDADGRGPGGEVGDELLHGGPPGGGVGVPGLRSRARRCMAFSTKNFGST